MCFSVQVDTNIKELARRFSAKIDTKSYQKLMENSVSEKQMTSDQFTQTFGPKRRPKDGFFKIPGEDHRVYPNYFTHVMKMEEGERTFTPMRYRIRPHGTKEEIPSKFNVYNARLDSLYGRKTWLDLIGRNHGIFAFNYFYEWVEHKSKKRLISFNPEGRDLMWAPCLWDEWISKDGKFSFMSFAIITTEPPREVFEMGHDRCPYTIKENEIDDWLSGKASLLNNHDEIKYSYKWVG